MSEGSSPDRSRAALLPIRVGDLVAGKYRVDGVLGRGGMGAVFSAQQEALRRPVALKVLLPEIVGEAGICSRFIREAQLAASLRSEHVVQTLDVGTLETGEPFLVMERLEGLSLSDLSKERGPLPVHEAIDYILQASEALLEAHGKGIIHRDLKPANMFVTRRPSGGTLIKVLDFGLAKVIDSVSASHEGSLTATGMLAGSPHYAPPEQLRSLKHADVRSDIWALGVVLYELLTRHRPFEGADGVAGIIARVLVEAPAPLQTHRKDIPPALVALVHSCLEKDPARRPQTAMELVQALRVIGRAVSAAVDSSANGAAGAHADGTGTMPLLAAALVGQTLPLQQALPVAAAAPLGVGAPTSEGATTAQPFSADVVAKRSVGTTRTRAVALSVVVVGLVGTVAVVGLLARPGEPGSVTATPAAPSFEPPVETPPLHSAGPPPNGRAEADLDLNTSAAAVAASTAPPKELPPGGAVAKSNSGVASAPAKPAPSTKPAQSTASATVAKPAPAPTPPQDPRGKGID